MRAAILVAVVLFCLVFFISISFASVSILLQNNITENLGDSFTSDVAPSTNYGTEYYIAVRGVSGTFYSFILWNLSVIPSNSTIVNAVLGLYMFNAPEPDNRVYNVYNTTSNDWIETTINWTNKPSEHRLQDNVSIGNISGVWITWDVTNAAVFQHSQSGNRTLSLKIRDNLTSGEYSSNWYSRDYAVDISLRPYLNVTYDLNDPSFNINLTNPLVPLFKNNVTIYVNVTVGTGSIVYCNFTLVAPNGSVYIDNLNGTWYSSDLWNSSAVETDLEGQWNVTARASDDNGDVTELNWSFTVTDDPPEAVNVSVLPVNPNTTSVLNCTYVYSDNETNAESSQWFMWFRNGVLNETSSQVVTSGNLTAGDNWSCAAMVNDSLKNSTWTHSSNVTVNDTIVPVNLGYYLSAYSGYTDTIYIIYVNCTDLESNISSVTVDFIDPNAANVGNKTMLLVNGTLYSVSYTFNIVGQYHNFTYWCIDDYGNVQRNNTNMTFDSSTHPVVSGGSPGGGGGITFIETIYNITTESIVFGDGVCGEGENYTNSPDCKPPLLGGSFAQLEFLLVGTGTLGLVWHFNKTKSNKGKVKHKSVY